MVINIPHSGRSTRKNQNAAGVSEVVGEMLMVVLVVILLSVFSAALYNYLPADREPSISIMITNDTQGNITLWHKGGDWIEAETLSVILMNETSRRNYRYNQTFDNKKTQFMLVHPNRQQKKVFDLGSNISVAVPPEVWNAPTIRSNMSVRLVTSRTVLYSGRIGL